MCYESRGFQISEKRANIYTVEPAEAMKCWTREWCWVCRQFGESGEMIVWMEGRDGASEESDEFMTKSSMWFLSWVGS